VSRGRSPHVFQSALILTIQLLPCLALILLGWGFDSLPAFFMSAPRAGLMVVTLTAASVAAYCKIDFNPLRKGAGPVGNQNWQLGVLLLLSLALLWFLPFAEHKEILRLRGSDWPYLGLLLFTVGVIVRVAALRALGENFSAYVTLQPNHQLVQNGIYTWIRHPLYLSLLLIPTGIALVFASLLAAPILILAVAFVSDRMRREDCLLASHFGPEFEAYCSRTRRLIPLVF
jgi:protein-S-isoprenylcysteine O-methyltransferase Ste14